LLRVAVVVEMITALVAAVLVVFPLLTLKQ
jgi:hypothetical protein